MRSYLALFFLLACTAGFSQSKLQVVNDTVRISNAELVLRNSTQNIGGFLYNAGNGKTRFIELGKSLQFNVGSTVQYSQPGDTSYTNADFIGRNIKVWKNGLFQYRSNVQGIKVDSTIGRIIFKPALQSGDKIYIEALYGVNLIADLTEPTGSFTTNLSRLNAGINTSGQNFTLRWATNNKTLTDSPRVVGLGSSTLAGQGLTAPNRLGDKIQAWLGNNTINSYWNNLAVSGYSSINLLPVANNGNASTNIEAALSYNPDFIFISLPSNDATGGLSVNQSLTNYRLIDKLAAARGVPVFWGTTQPRNATLTEQQRLKDLADSTRANWPDRYVESFIDLFDVSAGTPAAANPAYLQADGLHFTSEGNQYVANRLFTRWSSYFQAIEGVTSYTIEKSSDSLTWSAFDVVTNPNTVKKVYTRTGTDSAYFRVKANYTNGGSSAYSNAALLPKGVSADTAWTNATRVLLEFGGNGTSSGYVVTNPDNGGKYWNNITGQTGVGFVNGIEKNSLITTANQVTALGIRLLGTPYGTFGTPSSTAGMNFSGFNTAVQDYPAEAVRDNMFVHQYAGDTIFLRLKGLQRNATYRVKIWGARLDTAAGLRVLEAKTGAGGSWTGAKSFNARYHPNDPADYDRAIVLDDITGVDSIDINVRAPIAHSIGHISLLDIKIKDYNPVLTTGVNYGDVSKTLPDSSAQLTGTVNSPGSVSLYAWSQISGPNNATITNGNTATPTMSNLRNGTYVFTIVVTYNNGQQATDNATVTVYPDNNGLKTTRVHFSNAAATTIPGWLNVFGQVATDTVTKADPVTGWRVGSPVKGSNYWNPFNGINSQDGLGASTGNNTGIVPDIALANYWFNNLRGYDSTVKRHNVIISNLDNSKTYTIRLIGSRALVTGQQRWSAFYINGNINRHLLDANNNKTNQILVTGVSTDGSGKINIGVFTPLANGATYGPYSYLNALIIQEEN